MAMILFIITMLLIGLLIRWILAVPLVRTLSAVVDTWADSVRGDDASYTSRSGARP